MSLPEGLQKPKRSEADGIPILDTVMAVIGTILLIIAVFLAPSPPK